jgi:hypothetical protein
MLRGRRIVGIIYWAAGRNTHRIRSFRLHYSQPQRCSVDLGSDCPFILVANRQSGFAHSPWFGCPSTSPIKSFTKRKKATALAFGFGCTRLNELSHEAETQTRHITYFPTVCVRSNAARILPSSVRKRENRGSFPQGSARLWFRLAGHRT